MKAIEKKILALILSRKIILNACKAYIKSQRRLGSKREHSREEITAAWLDVDQTIAAELKKLKGAG